MVPQKGNCEIYAQRRQFTRNLEQGNMNSCKIDHNIPTIENL